jgi:hypothetical protein
MVAENTLAYYNMATITSVKSLIGACVIIVSGAGVIK